MAFRLGPYRSFTPIPGLARAFRKDAKTDEAFNTLIREAERRAERLIGVLRIFVALALAVVFNAAVVGTAPTDDPVLMRQLELARMTIGVCVLIGIAAILLSSERRHRMWFAYGFVAADVSFVVASLMLALRNIGLESSFVAALPTIWLAPLVLSFNALRYSAGVQVFGGVLLIAGLIGLGVLAPVKTATLVERGLDMFQTPPNTMRLAMIAVTCVVLSVAVLRARRLLYYALYEERQRRRLSAYMPPQVADLIAERSQADLRQGRRQMVSILFIDIRGFTARTEPMAPPDVGAFLAKYRNILRNAADAHGAVIDKFMGDGAMIVFGIPEPQKDDAVRAARCADAICAAVADWSESFEAAGEAPVRIGIGMHHGEAFVGAIGDDARLEFTVIGDAVNVASRLEEATKTLQAVVVASFDFVEASAGSGDRWRDSGEIAVRGRSAPVRAFVPDGAPGAALTVSAHNARLEG